MVGASVSVHCSPPPQLKLKENPVEEWKFFKQMYKHYSILCRIREQNKEFQISSFLNSVGPVGLRIYNTLQFSTTEDRENVETVMRKFDGYIIGEINVTYERYIFNKRAQQIGESIEDYVSVLRTLASTCGFCDCLWESLIRDRMILGISDNNVRKLLLQRRNLSLKDCIDICRSAESTSNQLQKIKQPESISKIKASTKLPGAKEKGDTISEYMLKECIFCCGSHIRRKELCPAWGKFCKVCGQRNHFKASRRCKGKKKNIRGLQTEYDDSSESDTEYVLGVSVEQEDFEIIAAVSDSSEINAEMLIDGKPVKFQIDSGASTNVIPVKYVDGEILPTTVKLKMWNHSVITALGKCRVKLRNPVNQKKYSVEFIVVEEDLMQFFGKRALEQMNLMVVNYHNMKSVHKLTTVSNIVSQYKDVFEGELGTLPGTVHLTVDPTVKPVVSAARRIPIALQGKVQSELDIKIIFEYICINIYSYKHTTCFDMWKDGKKRKIDRMKDRKILHITYFHDAQFMF